MCSRVEPAARQRHRCSACPKVNLRKVVAHLEPMFCVECQYHSLSRKFTEHLQVHSHQWRREKLESKSESDSASKAWRMITPYNPHKPSRQHREKKKQGKPYLSRGDPNVERGLLSQLAVVMLSPVMTPPTLFHVVETMGKRAERVRPGKV